MIQFPNSDTERFKVQGTDVTTTFSRLEPTDKVGEYQMMWVLDNNGKEQATSNGIVSLSAKQHSDLFVKAELQVAEIAARPKEAPPKDEPLEDEPTIEEP